nr:MAG TPA: hypothetical protein [Caudoviricetes sp.]
MLRPLWGTFFICFSQGGIFLWQQTLKQIQQ